MNGRFILKQLRSMTEQQPKLNFQFEETVFAVGLEEEVSFDAAVFLTPQEFDQLKTVEYLEWFDSVVCTRHFIIKWCRKPGILIGSVGP